MKLIINAFYKCIVYSLFSWYLYSIYLLTQDTTLSFGMLIAGEMSNIITLIILSRVIFFNYDNPNYTDFCLSFFTIVWFLYSTYRDMTVSYSTEAKILYVGIDILSILFLIDAFINFLFNITLFKVLEKNISMLKTYIRVTLFSIASILYAGIIKVIK